jgi:hypothetical protein
MTFLSFSLPFGLLAMLHVSWIQNSNFVLLCCQCTHQGGDCGRGSGMVKHRSRGQVMPCVVCTMHTEMRSTCFLVWPQNQGQRFLPVWPQNQWLQVSGFGPQNRQLQFTDLGLKIIATISWFGPKNMQTTVYQLRHKTDRRMKMAWDTCRDLAACFAWKQVGLGFPSLSSRLVEARHGWCMWYHRGGCVKLKLKTNGSMRWTALDPCTPTLLFSLYWAPRVF